MPSEDFTYTLALLFPMLNIMEFGPPPAFFVIRFAMICPNPIKITKGSIQVSRKLKRGEACSTISLVKVAPELYKRSVSVGSSILPVLYTVLSSLSVKTILLS